MEILTQSRACTHYNVTCSRRSKNSETSMYIFTAVHSFAVLCFTCWVRGLSYFYFFRLSYFVCRLEIFAVHPPKCFSLDMLDGFF